jgi:hypothetical protein
MLPGSTPTNGATPAAAKTKQIGALLGAGLMLGVGALYTYAHVQSLERERATSKRRVSERVALRQVGDSSSGGRGRSSGDRAGNDGDDGGSAPSSSSRTSRTSARSSKTRSSSSTRSSSPSSRLLLDFVVPFATPVNDDDDDDIEHDAVATATTMTTTTTPVVLSPSSAPTATNTRLLRLCLSHLSLPNVVACKGVSKTFHFAAAAVVADRAFLRQCAVRGFRNGVCGFARGCVVQVVFCFFAVQCFCFVDVEYVVQRHVTPFRVS